MSGARSTCASNGAEMTKLPALSLAAILAAIGCKSVGTALAPSAPPVTAESFLKWSMDQHARLRSFHTQYQLSSDSSKGRPNLRSVLSTLTLDYVPPNRFRIATTGSILKQAT